MQEQFYQLWENAPDSTAYNSGFELCLEGNLDLKALQAAAAMLFERQQVSSAAALHSYVQQCYACEPALPSSCHCCLQSLYVCAVSL